MKTEKITVNATPQQPKVVEIDIVQPEDKTEERLLCYLLTSHIALMKQRDQMPYELSDQFHIDHHRDGTFIAMSQPSTDETGGYYTPPKPVAIIGIRADGPRFDIIHAAVPEQQPAAMPTPDDTPQPNSDSKDDKTEKK